MKDLAKRITQAPVTLFDLTPAIKAGNFRNTADGTAYRIDGPTTLFLTLTACHDGFIFGQNEANAVFIVEAFNVAHETGMTPRQLADEVARLTKLIPYA